MPAFKTTAAQSSIGSGPRVNLNETAASSYTLENGAFLQSTDDDSIVLRGTAAWTVTINGQSSGSSAGLYLDGSVGSAAAKVTIGEDGSLHRFGSPFGALFARQDVAVVNKGSVVSATGEGMQLLGAGNNSVVNSGLIAGGFGTSVAFYSSSNASVTNSGTLLGDVQFANGTNKLINTGVISYDTAYGAGNDSANISFGSGVDTVDNKGRIDGFIGLGDGKNTLTNSGKITSVDGGFNTIVGGSNVDIVTNAKTGEISGGVILGDATTGAASDANVFTNAGKVGSNSNGNSYEGGSNGDKVTNSGSLGGGVSAGDGTNTLTNSGSIEASLSGFGYFGGSGVDTVTNAKTGVILGGVHLGNAITGAVVGTNSLTNAGTVGTNNNGWSYTGGLHGDKITNTGTLQGGVLGMRQEEIGLDGFGGGTNSFTNSGRVGVAVIGLNRFSYYNERGDDTVTNSKGGVFEGYVNLGRGNNKLTNGGTIGDDFAATFGVAVVFGGSGGEGGTEVDTVVNTGLIRGSVDLFGGNDIFTNTGEVTAFIQMGDGNDVFNGGNFSDKVSDGLGADKYNLASGDDLFLSFGGEGEIEVDTVDGGAGTDVYDAGYEIASTLINLDSINQTALGLAGNGAPTLTKSSASNLTGTGVDTLKNFENVIGSNFSDFIFGSSAANNLAGGGGADEIHGLAGNDTIDGGNGTDFILGGLGADVLRGGSGIDSFIYKDIKDSGLTLATRDVIQDFTMSEDTLDFSRIDADTRASAPLDQGFTNILTQGGFTVGQAGELRIYQTATGWMVEGEVNGDGKADFSIAVNDLDHDLSWGFGVNIIG